MIFIGHRVAQVVDGSLLVPEEWIGPLSDRSFYLMGNPMNMSIGIYPSDEWEDRVNSNFKRLVKDNEIDGELSGILFEIKESAVIGELDGAKIAINQELMAYCGCPCNGEVVLVGGGFKIEMWSIENWNDAGRLEEECLTKEERDILKGIYF